MAYSSGRNFAINRLLGTLGGDWHAFVVLEEIPSLLAKFWPWIGVIWFQILLVLIVLVIAFIKLCQESNTLMKDAKDCKGAHLNLQSN